MLPEGNCDGFSTVRGAEREALLQQKPCKMGIPQCLSPNFLHHPRPEGDREVAGNAAMSAAGSGTDEL